MVDGGSTDGTADGRAAGARRPRLRPRHGRRRTRGGTTPSNLNVGLAACDGEIVCRVDARTRIPTALRPHAASRCCRADPRSPWSAARRSRSPASADGASASGIARALNNRWGMGGSRYRRGAASGPTDTVYLGAFRTAELRRRRRLGRAVFTTNQDFDLNRRIGATGVVWFDAGLDVGYVPRRHLGDLWRAVPPLRPVEGRVLGQHQDRPQPRQVVLGVGPRRLAAGIAVLDAAAPPGAPPRRRRRCHRVRAHRADLAGRLVGHAGRPRRQPRGVGRRGGGWLSGV